jgi:hypothetical protein
MSVSTRTNEYGNTYDLHLLERLLDVTAVLNKVHHRLAPSARIRMITVQARRLTASSEEPGLDATIADLCCLDSAVAIIEGLAEGAVRTIDSTVVTTRTLKVVARLSGAAIIPHLAWRLSSVDAELVPTILRDAFDNVELGVPVLLVSIIV